VDDECVHGELKEDKLRRRCRDTSLQASSGGTRTSPRTEPWLAMQLGSSLGLLPGFFWRLSTKMANSLLEEWAKQRGRDGLVVGWPKTSRRDKSGGTVELENRRDLAMATPREGFPFYTSTKTQRSSQLAEVGTGGAIRRWPHGAR
jgi:hypothetical protein